MTIPATVISNVTPGVLSPGAPSLVMNALVLTQSLLMPTGSVISFASSQAVSNFFGPSSDEYAYAQTVFAGYVNGTQTPSSVLFAPYNAAARAGWLQSGSLANVSLATIQGLSGTLSLTVGGIVETSGTITLSGATSMSAAATLIEAGFTSPPFTVAWDAVQSAFIFTTTATGATETITVASGTIAAGLYLTAATGATVSQGAAADTPATAMNNAINASQNWATMSYITEPTLANKQAFAVWFSANPGYLGVMWDSDMQASVQGATEPFGVIAKANAYNGVMAIGGDPAAVPTGSTLAAIVQTVAAFVQGMVASINYSARNGSITLAGKGANSAAVVPTCANLQTYENLLANGYSCYAAIASRSAQFTIFQNGNMPGSIPWANLFVDQIWLNAQLQSALVSLYTSVGKVPYDPTGYGLIRASLVGQPTASGTQGPLNMALFNGVIQTGVALSSAQAAEVNQQAGVNAAPIIQTSGFYLQILDPGAQARAAGQTPIINLWYTSGSAVLQFNLSSINIL